MAVGIFAFTHGHAVREVSLQPFQVDATEVDGRIRLTWNPDLPQIGAATGGTFEVRKDNRSDTHPIEGKVLRQVWLDYIRSSEDVLLSVRLLDNGKLGSQSVVRVVAPVIAAIPPPHLATRPHMADHLAKVAKTNKVGKAKKLTKTKKPPKKHSSLH